MGPHEHKKPDGMTGASGKLTDEQSEKLDSFLEDLFEDGGISHNKNTKRDHSMCDTQDPDAHQTSAE